MVTETDEAISNETEKGIEQALETSAAIEDQFGSKERATEIRSKIKTKVKAEENSDELGADKKDPENKDDKGSDKKDDKKIVVDEQEASKDKAGKDKKDDSFFDPFAKKDDKGTDKKDDKGADKGKKDDKSKEKDVVSSVEKSKEELERDAVYPQLEEFHKKYKPVVDHPLVAAILDSGLPVIDALIKIQPKDYSIKSEDPKEQDTIDEWRAKEYFSSVENLKDKELEDAVEEFISMDEGISKRRERSAQITALNAGQAERIQNLTKESSAAKERKANNIAKLNDDISNFIASTTEKGNLFGMQLADGKAKVLEDGMKGFFKELFNPDGSVNLKPIVSAVYFEKFHKEAMREKIKKVKSETTQDVMEDVVQLDENNQSITNRKPKTEDNLEKQIDDKFSGEKDKK